MLFHKLRVFFHNVKAHFKNSTINNILGIVDFIPYLAGFSIRRKKISAPFWILHLSLLIYVYAVGSVVYQIETAESAEDFIKNYVNVSLLILISNVSFWWMHKRSLLIETLELIKKSDEEARSSEFLKEKYSKMLFRIKLIICIHYICNYTNASFIYLPNRVDVSNNYSMATCVGLEPLASSPNREICLTILFIQECTIMAVCLNYQALLLFLIAHTAAMYHMLSEELMAFNVFSDVEENKLLARERLSYLIARHTAILATVNKLKRLYSLAIGVDFGSNAVCIGLFCYLPLIEWLKYMPILTYCILAFFLYCFLCQRLTSASEVFERAVYSCGWENFDVREKKLVYVMLRQAQKPIILLAADIIPVNMYTFATTLKSLFKFVTVVKF